MSETTPVFWQVADTVLEGKNDFIEKVCLGDSNFSAVAGWRTTAALWAECKAL